MAISAINSSVAAMYRATDRFESSATKLVSPDQSGDEATAIVDMIGASQQFELATKVVKVASDMQKHAIDILA